jgi:hypothetical protein
MKKRIRNGQSNVNELVKNVIGDITADNLMDNIVAANSGINPYRILVKKDIDAFIEILFIVTQSLPDEIDLNRLMVTMDGGDYLLSESQSELPVIPATDIVGLRRKKLYSGRIEVPGVLSRIKSLSAYLNPPAEGIYPLERHWWLDDELDVLQQAGWQPDYHPSKYATFYPPDEIVDTIRNVWNGDLLF